MPSTVQDSFPSGSSGSSQSETMDFLNVFCALHSFQHIMNYQIFGQTKYFVCTHLNLFLSISFNPKEIRLTD